MEAIELGQEAKRLIDQITKNLSDLKTAVDQKIQLNPFLREFGKFIDTFSEQLDNSLRHHLENLRFEGYPPHVVARHIETLDFLLQRIIFLLRGFLPSQEQMPETLYHLINWFFSVLIPQRDPNQPSDPHPPYLISFAPSFNTTEFTQTLLGFELEKHAKDIYAALKNLRFYFIGVPFSEAREQSTISWSICLHEAGHIIDDIGGLVREKFTSHQVGYHILINMAERGDQESQDSLQTSEYLVDGFALAISGPLLARIFAKDYARITNILHPRITHPRDFARLHFAIDQLRANGFSEAADTLEKELEKSVPNPSHRRLDDREQSLQGLAKQILDSRLAGIRRYNYADFSKEISHLGGNTGKEIAEDFKEGKPIVSMPPFLFTLIALHVDIERELSPEQNEFLADMLRLGIFARNFTKRVLPLIQEGKDKYKGFPLRRSWED